MFEMNQDVFDSRDLIERLEELEALEGFSLDRDATEEDKEAFGREEDDELATLRKFADEANEVADWEHGETFISDDYFVDYCQEFLEDCGYIPRDIPPFIEIDWEKTAKNMQVDYTSYELDGNTYWARA